jgi:hypothetical protein
MLNKADWTTDTMKVSLGPFFPDVLQSMAEALGTVEVGYTGLLQPLGNGQGFGQRPGLGVADHDAEAVGGHVAGFDLVAMAVDGQNFKGQVGQGLFDLGQGMIDTATQGKGLHDHRRLILAAAPAHIRLGQAQAFLHDSGGIGGVPSGPPEGDIDMLAFTAGSIGQDLFDHKVLRGGFDGAADARQRVRGKGQGRQHGDGGVCAVGNRGATQIG